METVQPISPSQKKDTRRYLVGVCLLLSVVFLWTASNFATAKLETGEDSWFKPFLITYLNTSTFTLYLIPTYLKRRNLPPDPALGSKSSSQYQPLPQDDHPRSLSRTPPIVPLNPAFESATSLPPLTIRETLYVSAWWSAIWFIANWAINASLALTTVASVTILSSTSGFFTLGLGCLLKVESLTRTKIFAVVSSFIGVLLVTRADSTIHNASIGDLPTNPILGDGLTLVSAACYAVYVVMLKVRIGNEDRADMQMLLGFAGLFNVVFLLPFFPILHYTGWETFSLPPNKSAWTIIIINMCITVSSDYMYMLAMLKTTPMLVTIGLSLTIPLALVGYLFIPGTTPEAITWMSLGGAGMVLLGFVTLGWQGWKERQKEEEVEGDIVHGDRLLGAV